jgi:hypothetical protein
MQAMTDYIELHARSAFSFLEGASVPEEFAETCAAHQMPAMALLDRDGVYGAPRFYFAAKKLNLKAHIGAEITSLLKSPPNQKTVGWATPSSFGDRAGTADFPSSWERVGTEGSAGAPSKPSFGLDGSFCSLPRVSLLCASRVG